MSQVIEVRFLHPETREIVGDEFTQADSHSHAIDLALWNWSNGLAVLKDIERTEDKQGKWTPSPPCYTYVYHITLGDEESPSGERHMLAVLFASYKEREEQHD